jgi:hypothetical protein
MVNTYIPPTVGIVHISHQLSPSLAYVKHVFLVSSGFCALHAQKSHPRVNRRPRSHLNRSYPKTNLNRYVKTLKSNNEPMIRGVVSTSPLRGKARDLDKVTCPSHVRPVPSLKVGFIAKFASLIIRILSLYHKQAGKQL